MTSSSRSPVPDRSGSGPSERQWLTRTSPLTRILILAVAAVLAALGLSQAVAGTAAAKQLQPLDHFLCYTVAPTTSGTGAFRPVPGTRLVNQFAPNGIVPKVGRIATLHCNPTAKYINGQLVSSPVNPESHLLCLPLSGVPTQPVFTVHVTNQFGQGTLIAQQPNRLCLPSWKSLTGPPNQNPNQPPNLYHFTCYPVKYAAGSTHFRAPGAVSVLDQFDATGAPVPVTVGAPVSLCLPTTKILPTGMVYPADLSGLHLLCFNVSPTPLISPVWDQNQFGQAKLVLTATKYLCLPSVKTVVSPAHAG
ncbi:MAG TPA: hypothetical protein VGS19_34000 [Streptosporangiaceae bacterium]|nr:hypothetical protein [Streptosporangiaceae bacterium]